MNLFGIPYIKSYLHYPFVFDGKMVLIDVATISPDAPPRARDLTVDEDNISGCHN